MGRSARALLIPLPVQGHWTPFLQLIRHFVLQKVNFTVWTTARRADELMSYEGTGAFQGLEVECQAMFTDVVEGTIMASAEESMLADLKANEFDIPPSKFTCIITDIFLGEIGQALTEEFGIPRYCFNTSPAHLAFVLMHGPALVAEGWLPTNRAKKDQFVDLPGLERFTANDIPLLVDLIPESFRHYSRLMKGEAGMLINTFEDFDHESFDTLQRQLPLHLTPGKVSPKAFAVGPLLLLPDFRPPESSSDRGSEYVKWLDARPKASVLFVCFGSQSVLPPSTISEIAKALESIEVPFLWALRLPSTTVALEDLCPSGFASRTRERGLVVTGWVPQQELLQHAAVGGFLSHCGWNSILESISAGVPIVAGPMWAEQAMNARIMVDHAKIAVEIKHKGEIGDFDKEAIAKAITILMQSQEGVQIRQNMLKMQKAALAAVAKDGVAHRSFRDFVKEVTPL